MFVFPIINNNETKSIIIQNETSLHIVKVQTAHQTSQDRIPLRSYDK